MSDYADAIGQSSSAVSDEFDKAREALSEKRQIGGQLSSQLTAIDTKDKTPKAEDEGVEGIKGAGLVAGIASEGKSVGAIGWGNYKKAQIPMAKANWSGFKSGMGIGQKPATQTTREGSWSDIMNDHIGGTATDKDMVDMYKATKAEAPGGGLAESFGRKVLKVATDLPDSRVGEIAKGSGAIMGAVGAGIAGIEDISSGHIGGTLSDGEAVSEWHKDANIGSLISGGLDVAGAFIPALAPVAGLANVITGAMGVAGDEADKAKEKADATSANVQAQSAVRMPDMRASALSQGQVANLPSSQRAY